MSAARVGIAGAGRVGGALAKALRSVGVDVVCVAKRDTLGRIGARATHVIIAVSDRAIESVADEIARAPGKLRVALHTCAAYGTEPLRALAERGIACGVLHPLQTIDDPDTALLRGIAFAISGDPAAMAFAEEIARALDGMVLRIPPEKRALYHAAAVFASNYVTVLLDTAARLLSQAAIPERDALTALAPLARTAVENAVLRGPAQALTGPIARGDAETITAHLRALSEHDAELYRTLGREALVLARGRGLPDAATERIEALLRQ